MRTHTHGVPENVTRLAEPIPVTRTWNNNVCTKVWCEKMLHNKMHEKCNFCYKITIAYANGIRGEKNLGMDNIKYVI